MTVTAVTRISQERFDQANDEQEGWCTTCGFFTKKKVDAEDTDRECPVCDQDTVDGVKVAFELGYIEVDPDLFKEPEPKKEERAA